MADVGGRPDGLEPDLVVGEILQAAVDARQRDRRLPGSGGPGDEYARAVSGHETRVDHGQAEVT